MSMQYDFTGIPGDSFLSFKNEALHFFFPADSWIHAIQWKGDLGKGQLEFVDDAIPFIFHGEEQYNKYVLPYVKLWEAEKIRLNKIEIVEPTLEELRLLKLEEINQGYSLVMTYIQAGYPIEEVLSWDMQKIQAQELQDNPDAEGYFVRKLAEIKEVSVEEMCRRIMANAESWEPIAAMLTAERQLMEEACFKAETKEEIEALKVSYTA